MRSSLTDGAFGVYLGIQSFEARKSLAKLLKSKFFDSNTIMALSMDAKELLNNGSYENIIERFNAVLNSITYDNYPVINGSSLVNYHNIYLTAVSIPTTIELHNSKGRADLSLELKKIKGSSLSSNTQTVSLMPRQNLMKP